MGEPHFREGQLVEVTGTSTSTSTSQGGGEFMEDDAWFVATVIDLQSESNGTEGEFFLVEYQSILIEDEDGSKPLREYVHASLTRPLPPSNEVILDFQLNEHIDAFYKHGWREGVITRVSEDSRYGVCLRSSGEEMEIQNSNLRVHLEWVDGRWIWPEEQQQREFDKELSFTSVNLGRIMDSKHQSRACNTALGTEIAMQLASPSSADNYTEDVRSPDYATNSNDKVVENCILNTDAGLSLPSRKRKRRKATEAHFSQLACFVRTMCSATLADFDAQNDIHVSTSQSEEINQLKCSAMDVQQHAKSCIRTLGKRAASEVLLVSPPNLLVGSGKHNHPTDSESNRTDVPPQIMNMESVNRRKTQVECGDKQHSHQIPRRIKVTMGGIKTTQQTVVCKSTEFQKRRGKIRKDEVKEDNQIKGSGYKAYNGVIGDGAKVFFTGVSRNIADEVQSQPMMGKKVVSQDNPCVSQTYEVAMREEPSVKDVGIQESLDVAKHSLVSSEEAASLDNRCGDTIEEQHDINMIAVDNQYKNSREEQNEITLRSVDNNCIEVREEINRMDLLFVDNHSKEAREEHNEPVLQSPLIDLTDDAKVCIENESLPFLKCSFMWESIESMEAFQKMPQKPHFRPLEQYSLSHREGMAIGHMVTFATLVAKLKDSQIPREELEDMIDALVDLKAHGFDVEKIQARVQELLSIKDRHRMLEKCKECEKKITELSNENYKFDIKIVEFKKCVRELGEIMVEVNQGLKSLKKKKETNESDISALQMELDAIKDDLRTGECEYHTVSASPW